MVKKVSDMDVRRNLGQLLEDVYYENSQYVVERAGQPMAVVVPLWQFEEWQKRRGRFFETVEELWEQNKGVKPKAVEQDVARAVQAVRKKAGRRKGPTI